MEVPDSLLLLTTCPRYAVNILWPFDVVGIKINFSPGSSRGQLVSVPVIVDSGCCQICASEAINIITAYLSSKSCYQPCSSTFTCTLRLIELFKVTFNFQRSPWTIYEHRHEILLRTTAVVDPLNGYSSRGHVLRVILIASSFINSAELVNWSTSTYKSRNR